MSWPISGNTIRPSGKMTATINATHINRLIRLLLLILSPRSALLVVASYSEHAGAPPRARPRMISRLQRRGRPNATDLDTVPVAQGRPQEAAECVAFLLTKRQEPVDHRRHHDLRGATRAVVALDCDPKS